MANHILTYPEQIPKLCRTGSTFLLTRWRKWREKRKRKRKTNKVETTTTDKDEEIEEAKKQIPFTFKVPESYEELSGHFQGRDSGEKATILERIIKCNHPQFGGDNKAR
jgi:hypothetical protein